jgi:predicted MFS family arabinose efflux permease
MATDPAQPNASVARRPSSAFRPFGLSRDNALLGLAMLSAGGAIGCYQYILPLYASALGANPDQIGLTLAIGNSGAILGILAGGLFVNRFSYRSQICVAWLAYVPASILYVFAQSWETLALASFLDWATLFCIPALNAYIVLACEDESPGQAFTTVYAGITAGGAVTPVLGGILAATWGLRAPFVAALVLAVLSFGCILLIGERKPRRSLENDASESGSIIARLVRPFQDYRAALQNRAFRSLMLILSVIYLSTFIGVTLLPNYLHDRSGIDASLISAFGSAAAAIAVLASLVTGRLSNSVGIYRTVALTQLFIVGGLFLTVLAPGLGTWTMMVSGIGFALRGGTTAQQSLTRGTIATVVSDASAGPAYALQSLVFWIAQVVGAAVAGVVYALSPELPVVIAVVVGVPTVLLLGARSDAVAAKAV